MQTVVLVTDDVDGLNSTGLGKLSHGQADGRGSGVLNDEVARFELGEVVKKSVSNTSSAEENRGSFSRNVLRSNHHILFSPSAYSISQNESL